MDTVSLTPAFVRPSVLRPPPPCVVTEMPLPRSGPRRSDALERGDVLAARYRIEQRVGIGGMGAVYEATDLTLGRRVAIKTLLPEMANRTNGVERLYREARATSRAQHPNIVQLIDLRSACADEPAFLVMELLEGSSLEQILAAGRLAPERACRIAAQLLSALQAAHEVRVVHRDIKPSNVFITPLADGSECVKLLDFGIAKLLDAGCAPLTLGGVVIGTVRYASPEQITGSPVDARSDIFSAGALLYRMLTGHRPFEAEGLNLLDQVTTHEAPDACAWVPELDPLLAAIVDRAMSKDPSERFQSAAEMLAVLASFVATPSSTPDARQSIIPEPSEETMRDEIMPVLCDVTVALPATRSKSSLWRSFWRELSRALGGRKTGSALRNSCAPD